MNDIICQNHFVLLEHKISADLILLIRKEKFMVTTNVSEIQLLGVKIHDINELRKKFDIEELKVYFSSGVLLKWLEEHHYDVEAFEVSNLDSADADCRRKLCEIFCVPYEGYDLSQEEREALETKRKAVSKYTDDKIVLDNIHLVALTQEELAKLIDKNEKTIYLCDGVFSIPINKSGITYVGINNPKIETAFTKEQYKKAGIVLVDIAVAENVNPKYEEYAKEAARKAGYDDFCENHTLFTSVIHEKLKMFPLDFYCPIHAIGEGDYYEYDSRVECEEALYNRLKNAYDIANGYFDINSSKCFAVQAVEIYSERIENCFKPIVDELEMLCTIYNKSRLWESLNVLISNVKNNLMDVFNAEIADNKSYYAMYKFNYFIESTDIIENEGYYVSDADDVIFSFLEKVMAPKSKFHYEGSLNSIMEMERDLNKNRVTFFNAVDNEYKKYVDRLEELIEQLSKVLPEMQVGEDMTTYLSRALKNKIVG